MTSRQRVATTSGRRELNRGHRADSAGCHDGGRDAELKDLIGKVVDIPAIHFGVDVPEMYYRATILRRDSARRTAVVVRFQEDGSQYWLPIKDVRAWLDSTSPRRSGCTGKAADEFAASVLLDIRQKSLQGLQMKLAGIAS
ncbi:hypothetical protein BSKO_13343 [Bryopsis sp. KO-2023]|nr:hypothetical protein BSKO_13343 [Bryopsis sp. KO-2023]